jgi:hypothetical protein
MTLFMVICTCSSFPLRGLKKTDTDSEFGEESIGCLTRRLLALEMPNILSCQADIPQATIIQRIEYLAGLVSLVLALYQAIQALQ